MTVIRRSVAAAQVAASIRASKRFEQQIHELNNSKEENAFIEGARNPRGGAGFGVRYRDLKGFDETLLVKR